MVNLHNTSKPIPIFGDIERLKVPQGIEVTQFMNYGGKGDLVSYVFTSTTLYCYFIFEIKLLANLFPRLLKDIALEWFSSLPNNSIGSFNELFDAFYNHFHIHMGPKMTQADLMICKQKDDEKVIDFIARYQTLYSQVNINILDSDLQ